MAVTMDDAPTFFLYRDVTATTGAHDTAPLAWFPAKDSDELYDALRAKYPHLKKHSERMAEATLAFFKEERLAAEASPADATLWQGASWTHDEDFSALLDMESFSESSVTSPFASTSQDTSPWQKSVSWESSPELLTMKDADSTAQHDSWQDVTNAHSRTELGGMSSVFSLAPGDQARPRVRRKMTEAEKVEYRKRRQMKACDSCSKRKRKCTHNQTDVTKTKTKTIAKSTCAPAARPTASTWTGIEDFTLFNDFTLLQDESTNELDFALYSVEDINAFTTPHFSNSVDPRHLSWSAGAASSSSSYTSSPLETTPFVPGGTAAGGAGGLAMTQRFGRTYTQLSQHDLGTEAYAVLDRDPDRADTSDAVLRGNAVRAPMVPAPLLDGSNAPMGLPQDALLDGLGRPHVQQRCSDTSSTPTHSSVLRRARSKAPSSGPLIDTVLQSPRNSGHKHAPNKGAAVLESSLQVTAPIAGIDSRSTVAANAEQSITVTPRAPALVAGSSKATSLTKKTNVCLVGSGMSAYGCSIVAKAIDHTATAPLTESSLLEHQRSLRKRSSAVVMWHGLQRANSPSQELWRLRRRTSISSDRLLHSDPARLELRAYSMYSSAGTGSTDRLYGGATSAQSIRQDGQATTERTDTTIGERHALRRAHPPAVIDKASSSLEQLQQALRDEHGLRTAQASLPAILQQATQLALACILAAALVMYCAAPVSTSISVLGFVAISYLAQRLSVKDAITNSTSKWCRLARLSERLSPARCTQLSM